MTNSSPTGRDVTKDRLAADVTALLPAITLPATVGNDQQVMQNNTGTLVMQDLIMATKAIDNTTIPTDGQVLTYDAASGKLKFKTVTSTAMSQVQFLASQAALGNLVFATGNRTSSGNVCTYTPANGKTFTAVIGDANYVNNNTTGPMQASIKNNGTTRQQVQWNDSALSIAEPQQIFTNIMGDQLAGDGVKVYALTQDSTNGTNGVYGNFQGYIQ